MKFPSFQHHHQHQPQDPATANRQGFPLTVALVGQTVKLTQVCHRSTKRLLEKGLVVGNILNILSKKESGSVMVAVGEMRLVIGASLATDLIVTELAKSQAEESAMLLETKTSLDQMSVGEVGKILSYTEVARGYKGKLLSMGLTPGTQFKVMRVAPLGDPIAIMVRGFHLSLRRQEAAGLLVESLDNPTGGEDNE